MIQEFFNKNRNHIIIIALFLVVSIIYCSPVLSGKVMNQNDDLTAKALNHESEEYHKKTGEFIGWSETMFSGMPTSVGFTGPSNYSISLIYAFANMLDGFSFDVIFWCMVGMYIMFCCLGINPWLGALGSFIFAFSTINILSLEGGHVQKNFNIGLVPLLLGGIYLIFQKRYVWGFIAVAFGVNYQVGLGHYQITYYAAIAAAIMCIYYGIKWLIEKEFKGLAIAVGLLLLAAAFGTLSNLTVLNSYYASYETTRGRPSELTPATDTSKTAQPEETGSGLDIGYAGQWSYGLAESFTFFAPNASGGGIENAAVDRRGKPKKDGETFKAIQQNVKDQNEFYNYINQAGLYWGDQPFVGGPYYLGIIVFFLFFVGLFASNRNEKWWILAITLLFVFLGWGRHSAVYKLFFDVMPVFNKFRTPSMALSIAQIGVTLMAVLGIVALWKNENRAQLKKVTLYTSIGFGLVLLVLMLAPSTFLGFMSEQEGKQQLPDWFMSALIEDREAMAKKDALRSFVFLGLSFAVIWFYLRGALKNTTVFLAIIAGLIVIDLWDVDTRYLNKDNFVKRKEHKLRPTEANNAIIQRAQEQNLGPNYRVFNLTTPPTQDAQTSQYHHSIGGYHGAKLRKYQELIEAEISRVNPGVLSMLNTHFMIQNSEQGVIPTLPPAPPMGPAWFVQEVKTVKNADEEMAGLAPGDSSFGFNPGQTLVVQQKNLPKNWNNFNLRYDPAATIKLTSYAPHKLKYEYEASTDQVAVFSEVFYRQPDGDGWKAYIDNKEDSVFRANYILRAMKVPAGKHTIEFKYDGSKALGRVKLSFVFFILLVGVSIFAIYLKRRGKLKRLEA